LKCFLYYSNIFGRGLNGHKISTGVINAENPGCKHDRRDQERTARQNLRGHILEHPSCGHLMPTAEATLIPASGSSDISQRATKAPTRGKHENRVWRERPQPANRRDRGDAGSGDWKRWEQELEVWHSMSVREFGMRIQDLPTGHCTIEKCS